MTKDAASWPEPLTELRYALAEAEAEAPAASLRPRVLTAALAARRAGEGLPAPAAITPVEAFLATVEAFDSLLGLLVDEEWKRPALRDLDVQGLVGHLIGVERDFQSGLGMVADAAGADHIESTQSLAVAQNGRPSADTHRAWSATAKATLDHLAALDGAALDERVTLHGLTLPLRALLIVRSFELWTHEEDIRRATARPLAPPDSARLSLMIRLAVSLLEAGLARAGRARPGHTARLVVTGAGGGTFQKPLGPGSEGPPEVRVVVDGVSFCRLVANRIDAREAGVLVTGEETLAADLLAGAAALALD